MIPLFAPAAWLMNRLTYPQKFILVGLLLSLPLILLLSQYLSAVNADYEFTAKERIGLQYNTPVSDMLFAVQTYAVTVDEFLNGGDVSVAALDTAEAAVNGAVAQIDAVDARLGNALDARPYWRDTRAAWRAWSEQARTLTRDAHREAHEQLNQALLILITRVGNVSNLILDPDIDSYYLMDTFITKLPTVVDYLGRTAIDPDDVSAGADLNAGSETRVEILSGLIDVTLQTNLLGFGYALEYNPALAQSLSADFTAARDATTGYLNVLSAASSPTAPDVNAFRTQFDTALNAQDTLYENVTVQLDGLLVARLERFLAQRNAVLVFTALVYAGAIYLLSGFYLSVQRIIQLLKNASQSMINGHIEDVQLESRDELAQVVTAFNTVARELVTARDEALDSSRLKGQFLATMSHELRTPLNAIIGYTGIMLMGIKGKVDDVARVQLERIKANGEHLLSLINDVLDIAKIEAGQLELVSHPIPIEKMTVRWMNQMEVLAQKKGLSFEINVDEKLPEQIMGDEDRLTQIALNLMSNAIKFTEKGGVTCELTHLDRKGEARILIAVTDTGIGIPPHALEYIFDEFRQVDGSTQRAYGGTGLGLAITRKLCMKMDGGISVKSEMGEGSIFTIELPLNAVAALSKKEIDHAS